MRLTIRKHLDGTSMENSPHLTTVSSGSSEGTPTDVVESPERILELLADERVQRILAITADEYMTVATIADECNLPIATAYRKVNALNNQGLLAESVRVRPHGKNVHVYSFCAVDIHVSVSRCGTPDVRFSITRPESGTDSRTVSEETQSG